MYSARPLPKDRRSAETAPVAGLQFGPFRLGTLIAEGGMGEVYAAHDVNLDRPVALKLLSPDLSRSPAYSRRFLSEARMLAQLDHPNIVTIFACGKANGRLYLAMEWIAGESVADVIDRGTRMKLTSVLNLSVQLARALHHAHEHGIVHRDVHSANLLLTRDSLLKVADFGIARALAGPPRTEAGAFMGTPPYCSPEQCMGAKITPRSDLFSVGVVMFEMLTGQLPYAAEDADSLVRKARTTNPPRASLWNADVPDEIDALIMACLAYEAEERPASAEDVADCVAEALVWIQTDPKGRRRRRTTRDVRTWHRQVRTRRVAGAATGLVAAAATCVLGLWGGKKTPPPMPDVRPMAASPRIASAGGD